MRRFLPDYSRAEKSYRAASIQRDHLSSSVIGALEQLDQLAANFALPDPISERVSGITAELERGLDAAEATL